MISKTDEERYRYEMRVKAMRDYVNGIEAARLEGHEKGHEKGLEKGQWLGRVLTLQELLGEIVATSEELQEWDIDRLKGTAESLQARLRGRT